MDPVANMSSSKRKENQSTFSGIVRTGELDHSLELKKVVHILEACDYLDLDFKIVQFLVSGKIKNTNSLFWLKK